MLTKDEMDFVLALLDRRGVSFNKQLFDENDATDHFLRLYLSKATIAGSAVSIQKEEL